MFCSLSSATLERRTSVAHLAIVFALVYVAVAACSDSQTPSPDAAVDMAPVDAAPVDPCASCAAEQLCVQSFDGTCTSDGPVCVTVSADCIAGTCDPECEPELCNAPYQCQLQVPCGTEYPTTDVYCYGP